MDDDNFWLFAVLLMAIPAILWGCNLTMLP